MDPHLVSATKAAERLLEVHDPTLTRCSGGANSRVYRVETEDRMYALKQYPSDPNGFTRLSREFRALSFIARHGLDGAVPIPITCDETVGYAIYSWLEGAEVLQHDVADLEQVGDFLQRLDELRNEPEAQSFAPAVEAGLTLATVLEGIERRLKRLLKTEGPKTAQLHAFLRGHFWPLYAAMRSRIAHYDKTLVLPQAARTLSPSDFSYHNTLRSAGGQLRFLDFEYFGWDDPVKLVSDFLWHPAHRLEPWERDAFTTRAAEIWARDKDFLKRLDVFQSFFALKWVLIILNEFLPETWARRSLSGSGGGQEETLSRQLAKAEEVYLRVLGDGSVLEA